MKNKLYRLLRWSEKYTKTDMLYLTKGGFWVTLGYLSQIVSSLVLTVAFANFIDKESYGTYQYVMAGAAIISAFSLSGMAIAIKRSVAQGNEGALRYGFGVKLLWSGTITLLSGCVSAFYFFNGDFLLGKAFIIVGLFSPFIDSFSLYKSYLTGTRRFKESAFLGFWRKPIVIITVLAALALTNDPLIILFVYFFSNTVSTGLLYQLVTKKYELPITKDPKALSYSKHLSLIGIAGSIGNNADKIIIFSLLGPQAVAIYSFATLPAVHFLKLFGFVSSDLIFPKFVERTFGSIKKSILKKVVILFSVTLVVFVAYTLCAEIIFKILFPAYSEAVLYSQIAMLAILTKPGTLFGLVFTAHGFKKVQYFIMISTNALKILLLLLLIPYFGLWGAIITLVVTHVYWSIMITCLFYLHKSVPKLN